MKKKLSIVLAVILPVILILTCVTSAYAWWWPWPPLPPDDITEDFEWGVAGETWLSASVHWEVAYYGGDSFAKIDDVHHGDTGRSAEFYRDGSNNVYAYYETDTSELSSIRFYVQRASTAYVDFRCGDGEHCIWVRIRSDKRLQYYDYPKWYTVYNYVHSGPWYKIEFKSINWNTGTFDIYVNGALKRYEGEPATMHDHGGFDEGFYFENLSPSSGSFWIDDILCSLEQ